MSNKKLKTWSKPHSTYQQNSLKQGRVQTEVFFMYQTGSKRTSVFTAVINFDIVKCFWFKHLEN